MSELQRANDAQLKESTQPTEQGRFLRAEFVASHLLRGGGGYYLQKLWEDSKVHLLKELHLRLHEGSEVQKLQLCTEEDLKGVPPERIACATMKLERGEKVVGFRMNAVQSQAGSTVYFNVQVVLESEDGVRAEPLSREQLHSKHPDFPGRQLSLESNGSPKLEICALRSMRGQHRDHLVGLIFQSWHGVESATGQNAMYWIDLLALTGGLYYLDVVTDVQQIALFLAEGQYEYFALSCLGVAIPMIATVIDAVRWSEGLVARPQRDAFRRSLPSAFARLTLIFMSVLTQCHMILLVLASMQMRIKHDLLLGAKHAEVAEAVISAGLQTNFWFLIIVGMESVSSEDFRSLTFSIGISVASLAFGFAGRDRNDARVLGVPGKLGWEPIFMALFVVRAFEVTSRLLALNMLHLATRTSLPLGGPVAVGVLVAWAYFCFPEAEKVHVFAAAIAHPGQVLLGNRSRMPLRFSLAMHIFLQVAAVALQGLVLFSDTWLPEAKEVPWLIIAASVATSICSSIGLCALALYGNSMEHPFLKMVAGGKRLTCTMLATAVQLPQAPTAVYAMAKELWLDSEALKDPEILQKLASSQARVCIESTAMRKLEMLPDDRWELLKHLEVIKVNFTECTFEEANAAGNSEASEGSQRQNSKRAVSRWDSLRWTQLESVWFGRRANAEALDMVARCHQLTDIALAMNKILVTVPWKGLLQARWSKLRSASFVGCFSKDESHGVAAEVLKILARCSELEVLNFEGNKFPTTQQWDEQFAKGCWPKLRREKCNFPLNGPSQEYWREQATRATAQQDPATAESKSPPMSENSAGCFCVRMPAETEGEKFARYLTHVGEVRGAAQMESLAERPDLEVVRIENSKLPASACLPLERAIWPELRVASFQGSFMNELAGAHAALGLLARCKLLEEIELSFCGGIPAEAWERLWGAEWPLLKTANFNWTFKDGAPGCSKAAMVLEVLGKCSRLVELNWRGCDGTTVQDFKHLPDGCWPLLESVGGMEGLERLCRTEEPAADSTAIALMEKETQTELQRPEGEIADHEGNVTEPEVATPKPKKKKKRWVTKTKAKRHNQNPPASEENLPA